jgi:hypothetical protein
MAGCQITLLVTWYEQERLVRKMVIPTGYFHARVDSFISYTRFAAGYDNSGRAGGADWATQQSNIDRTIAVIRAISQEFSAAQYSDVVTALSILNEPAGYLNAQLLAAARQYSSRHLPLPLVPLS